MEHNHFVTFSNKYPGQESNLYLRFRKPLFYPLNYGGDGGRVRLGRGPFGREYSELKKGCKNYDISFEGLRIQPLWKNVPGGGEVDPEIQASS